MSAETARAAGASTAGARRLGPGWPTIAAKEFADHVLSARFYVLLAILGVAALIPLYFAAEQIKNAASSVSGAQAVFLFLFTVGPQDISLLRVDQFVGIAAPLLGVAFAFDAINGERHEGTLPRLLSQPIHRDDVINGKFVAGLAVIALVLAAVVGVIAGFGLLRLGIVPEASEIIRIVGWYLLTVLYVALWLAFGLLLSVVISRAATSALVGLGVWLFVAVPIFGQLIVSIVGGFVAPGGGTAQDILSAASAQQFLLRLLPSTLYSEASVVLLDPSVTTVSTPTLGQYIQAQQQVPTLLSLDQSVLLVWPHIVALLALTVVCFALAYASFMRQEVRA
ncbi:MAG TPA: ABC transporter permease [Candidatus Limnocylindrales bacterium]